jgi:hypothetical protein
MWLSSPVSIVIDAAASRAAVSIRAPSAENVDPGIHGGGCERAWLLAPIL